MPRQTDKGLSNGRNRRLTPSQEIADVSAKEKRSGERGPQFELLVDAVQDYAIFILDPAGNVKTWNAGANRIKQYTAAEIIGQHFSTFYPEEDKRNGKPQWELEVAKKEGRFEDEGWRVRKDGSRFWANVIITPLRDKSGKLVGFGKVTRDFTERMETKEALAKSESRSDNYRYTFSIPKMRSANGSDAIFTIASGNTWQCSNSSLSLWHPWS